MKVYVSSQKMFMFWGHDGELFATSVIKRDMGDVKTHFWNLGRPYNRVVLITQSSWFKLLPVVFVFLLVYYLRKHLSFRKSE